MSTQISAAVGHKSPDMVKNLYATHRVSLQCVVIVSLFFCKVQTTLFFLLVSTSSAQYNNAITGFVKTKNNILLIKKYVLFEKSTYLKVHVFIGARLFVTYNSAWRVMFETTIYCRLTCFYFFWQTFLSLPEHQATSMGFIPLVTGHCNVLVSLSQDLLVVDAHILFTFLCMLNFQQLPHVNMPTI